MSELQTIKVLKICIFIGICLLLLGHYLISYTNITQSMGVGGMVLSAACVALGLIFSLPTKMYLTFLLVTRENRHNHLSDKRDGSNKKNKQNNQ